MEGKDSFILYTKYIHTFNMLTNEQAGHLIKHILNYVNDLIPEEQEDNIEDPVVRIAWVSIKLDLKAALVKWRDTCKKRSDAGKKGGRPKKEEKQTKPKKANALFEKQTKPKKADNDNEYDNDNDYVLSNDNNNVSKDTMAAISNDNRQPTIILPCLSNYNHPIFEEDIEHYKELYPAVDIITELKKMLGWLESNPSNKKTKNGIKAFISRWLAKCQDKAPKVETESSSCGFVDFQRLGETDEEYEKRTGLHRAKRGGFGKYDVIQNDDPNGFGGNEL